MKRLLFALTSLLLSCASPSFAQFNGDGLEGVYFTNSNITSPAVTLVDPVVSYRWNGCPPQPGMSGTSFSVKWKGQVEPSYSEPYTFTAQVNGGVSVIVNGQVLISQWFDYPPPVRAFSGEINLTAGIPVSIEVDYFTNGGNPTSDVIQLAWQSPSQGNEYIPKEYLFSGAALQPTPTPQMIQACQAGVTVDGVLSESSWNASLPWNTAQKTVLGNSYGTTAQFKTLWDSSNLYFGVTVTDSKLTNTGTASEYVNSTVELFLDTTDFRGVTVTGNDFQYFFRWNDTSATEAQGRTAGVSLRTATILPTGYVVEASIPWSTLGMGSPGPGTTLGIDVGVDVNHNGGNCRDGQIMWNGGSDNYSNASGYGQMSLQSACPTPVPALSAPSGDNPYVAPNPTNGATVQFVYTMASSGTAKIKVWNAWGNLVGSLSDSKPSGLQSSVFNVSSLAPGHYFYRVELDYGTGQSQTYPTQVLAVRK